MVIDGEDTASPPDLMLWRASDAPAPRFDAAMDAAATSLRSDRSVGEGWVAASTGAPSFLGPASAAPFGEPRQLRLKSIIAGWSAGHTDCRVS